MFFTRQGNSIDAVPGCSGQSKADDDYCTVCPSYNYFYYKGNGNTNLSLREGDCDKDAGFYCFKKPRCTCMPGCNGAGVHGKDYCIPKVTPSRTKQVTGAPTMKALTLSPNISSAPIIKEITLSPTKQVTSAPTTILPLVNVGDGGNKNACEGEAHKIPLQR